MSDTSFVFDTMAEAIIKLNKEVDKFNKGETKEYTKQVDLLGGKDSVVKDAFITMKDAKGMKAYVKLYVGDQYRDKKKTDKKEVQLTIKYTKKGKPAVYTKIRYEIKDGKVVLFPFSKEGKFNWTNLTQASQYKLNVEKNKYAQVHKNPHVKGVKLAAIKKDITPPPAELVNSLKLNTIISHGVSLYPKGVVKQKKIQNAEDLTPTQRKDNALNKATKKDFINFIDTTGVDDKAIGRLEKLINEILPNPDLKGVTAAEKKEIAAYAQETLDKLKQTPDQTSEDKGQVKWTSTQEAELQSVFQEVQDLKNKEVFHGFAKADEPFPEADKLAGLEKRLRDLRLEKAKTTPNQTNNDIAYNIGYKPTEDRVELEKAKAEIARMLPDNIEFRELDTMFDNMINKGIAWGAFSDMAVYISKEAEFGTEYHEAFHAIFRTLLTNGQIDRLYRQAAAHYGKPTAKQLKEFRAKTTTYQKLTNEELTNIWYEEKMAEAFQKFAVKRKRGITPNFLVRIFNKIKRMLRFISQEQYELELLFSNIYAGRFKNKSVKYNVFSDNTNPAFTLLATQEETPDGNLKTGYLSSVQSNRIINTTANKAFQYREELGITIEEALDEAIKDMFKHYSTETWADDVRRVIEKDENKAIKIINNIRSVQEALDLTRLDENGNVFKPNVELIKKEALHRINIFNEVEIDEEYKQDTAEDEGPTESWDKSPSEVGGMGSASKAMRIYFGFTPMFVDEFGFGDTINIKETDKRFKLTADGHTAYNGIERVLADTPKSDMLEKLYFYSRNNPNSAAIFNRIVGDIRSQLPEDKQLPLEQLIQLPYEDLAKSNWYQRFIGQFHKDKVTYQTILFDTIKLFTKVFNANTRDVKQQQFDEWAKQHEAKQLSKQEILQVFENISILVNSDNILDDTR